ncbi:MAG: hypothetical protein PHI84_02245 [Kiritimatiellae bacterium]|nr:hypothetical protein [Kiritimatiellia bacterium]
MNSPNQNLKWHSVRWIKRIACIVIIGVLLAIAIPFYIQERNHGAENAWLKNRKIINAGKTQAELAQMMGYPTNNLSTDEDIIRMNRIYELLPKRSWDDALVCANQISNASNRTLLVSVVNNMREADSHRSIQERRDHDELQRIRKNAGEIETSIYQSVAKFYQKNKFLPMSTDELAKYFPNKALVNEMTNCVISVSSNMFSITYKVRGDKMNRKEHVRLKAEMRDGGVHVTGIH